jgi:hypothetical protein
MQMLDTPFSLYRSRLAVDLHLSRHNFIFTAQLYHKIHPPWRICVESLPSKANLHVQLRPHRP